MADGFVLNISETMLKRLEAADEKIDKIGRTSETAMDKVKKAFETKGVAGVNAFIEALNNAQVELSKFKDVKVGLSLDPNALENLKKQIASVSGANVGVNVGGVQGGGTLPEGFQDSLKTLISEVGKLSAALTEAVKKKKELTEGSSKGAKNSVSDVEKEIKEYKRLSDELTRIEKQMYNLKKTQVDLRNSGKVTADLEQKYTEQWIRLNNKKFDIINQMSALEKKHGKELSDIQRKRGSEAVALAQKEEKDKQRIRANELKDYERIYSRMMELNRLLYENERNKRSTKDPKLQFQYYDERLNLMQEYNSLFSQRKNMEQKLGNEVISIQNKFRQQEIALERKKQEDKINEVRRALRRRREIEARWERRNARMTEQQRTTYQGSMDYSRNAKSINEQIQAIKYLQNARNNLQRTDANYTHQVRMLNREIERQQKQLEKLGVASGIAARNHRNLMDISGQLGRSLALMFSVSQVIQYISKIVTIRKEMELQQKSLQILIQDMDAANKLWNQTIDLAVKSPFRVKELITYTKQLAAYRIETDKLHDTTRRLADVSAGLGVDMQRLILAFGQVKAASFLRGCLGKGTPIRLYNEDIKEVQNIVVGDVIMGDDNTPRNVKEIIYGKEQMYIVKQGAFGDDYRVNENHILTLKDNITGTIVDVYVKDCLKDKERYNGVKISPDGNIIDYPIELIKDNIDEYFGFVIDGNKRFLLSDGTITHNTELRQFTEAGIPMLEELAEYFGEIQGRAISVAEVFDMISKRMVTFTDVENVFHRMTDAGGTFYKMQEEQSKTVAGMLSNLGDSMDLALNEMGKASDSIIKTFINIAKSLFDNWEKVASVLKVGLTTLVLWKTTTFLINKNVDVYLKLLFQSQNVLKTLLKDLKGGLANIRKSLKSVVKGGWISMAITGVIFLITKLIARQQEIKREIEDTTKRYKEFADTVKELNVEFSRLEGGNLEEYQEKLSTLVQLAERDYLIEVDFEVKNLKDIDEVKAKFSELEMQMMRMNNFALNFELSYTDLSYRGLSELWDEDINKDINQLSDSYSALYNNMRGNMNDLLYLLNHAEKPLNEAQQKIVNALNPMGDTETERDYFKRLISVYPSIESLYKEVYDKLKYKANYTAATNEGRAQNHFEKLYGFDIATLRELYQDYTNDLLEAEKESATLFEKRSKEIANIITFEGLSGEQATARAEDLINYALKQLSLEKEWNEYTLDEMRAFANEYFGDKYEGFNILPVIEPKEPFKGLKSWQQEYNKFIEDYSKTLKDAHDKIDETDEIILGALPIAEDEQGYATTQRKKLKEIEELLEDERELLKQATDENGKVIDSFAESFDLEASKTKISLLEMLWKWLGGEEDDKSKGKRGNIIKDQINLIKQLYEEYQKLSKEMSATEARSKVRSGFADAADEYGLNIAGIDFTNLQGVLEALQTLVPQAQVAGKDAMQELSKSIGETEVELELLAYVKAREDFDDEIKQMFSGYEISLELDKLNIPKTWAKDFFGVDIFDLDDIKSELNKGLKELNDADADITSQLANKNIKDNVRESLILQQQGNKQQREDIKTHLDKVAEMEAKAQEERLKTYLAYARGAIGERAKIKFEELTKLAEIEKTFTEENQRDVKKRAEERARKDAEDALKKLDWEEFQKSDTFINLFKDLDGASEAMLDHMIDKLNSFKNTWTDMPLDDMKQIIDKVNELEVSLARIKPSETLRDIDKSITTAMAERGFEGGKNAFFDMLREENIGYETQMNDLANIISNYELYIRLKEEGKDSDADSLGIDVKSVENAETQLSLKKQEFTKIQGIVLQNNNLLATDLQRVAALKAQEEALSQAKQMANDLYGSFQELYKALGGMEDTDLSVFADMGMNMMNSVMSAIQLNIQLKAATVNAKNLGIAMNTAMGVIGWIVMAVQLITQVISSIAKSRDNRLVKQIEEAQRKVENLQKAYDKLSEAIDEAWNVAQLKEYQREVEKTTEQLILAQKAAIAAQQQRKGANTVGSDEWNELQDMIAELETFEQQLEEIQESIFSKITAGVLDNVLDVADSWVDAWYDAFKEIGDGLSGLEDNFDDMFSSLVKRHAAMKIAGRFVDEWENVLERYAQGSDLSTGEIKAWAEKIKNDLPALNSQLEAFFSSFDSMLNDTEGELTGLQRGIQGITEQQADILASYLNSIRFIIMDSNAQLKLIAAANTNENAREENPMLVQMRIVAQQTTAINTLLNTLVKTGHNMGGNGLKVFI